MPHKLSERGQALIALIIFILLIGSTFMIGGFTKPDQQRIGDPFVGTITGAPEPTDGQNLQLKTFSFIIPSATPIPTNSPQTECNHDNGVPAQVNDGQPVTDPTCTCRAMLVECHLKQCTNLLNMGGTTSPPTSTTPCGDIMAANNTNVAVGQENVNQAGSWQGTLDSYCASPNLAGDGDGTYCIGKPVIYLYPTKPTHVDVEVKTPGKIFVSDPLYPNGGWKNVLANPDGTLVYKGKDYRELFYESEVSDFIKPTHGIIIKSSNFEKELRKNLYGLGLSDSESREFMDFWIPRLKNLNSRYILFSIIEATAKQKVDKVLISPEPDTRIEFIAYFKPLDKLVDVKPLILPTRPERIGFTAVEWGGVIDNKNPKLE